MQRALVTGGVGYNGSHTAKILAESGCEPIVIRERQAAAPVDPYGCHSVCAAARPVRVELHPRRPGDPPVPVADASKAGRVLGWHGRRPHAMAATAV